MVTRRVFLSWLSILGFSPKFVFAKQQGISHLYGLIGNRLCAEDKRKELAEILLAGIANMPGCLSYIIAEDEIDQNALWISKVWIDEKHQKASINLPTVQEVIKIRSVFNTGFGERFETSPLGGKGLE